MLTPELKEQFDKVIAYSQYGIENPDTEDLLTKWVDSKVWMYGTFMQKQLVRSFGTITLEATPEMQAKAYGAFKENVYNVGQYGLYNFLRDITVDEFYNNSLAMNYPLMDDKVIPAGTKVIKSFKYFISDLDDRRFWQDLASRLTQERQIVGELCISIHPLDFLSVSENTHNWRSCHALDGEYRAGNLSYMNDSVTCIAYLKSKGDVRLPHFPEDVPWNNKKWRCLMFFGRGGWHHTVDYMFAGRQYPYALNGILDMLQEHLIPHFSYESHRDEWTPWSDYRVDRVQLADGSDFMLKDDCFPIGGILYNPADMIKNATNARHYNDLLYSSCYEPMYSWRKKAFWSFKPDTSMTVGSEVKCLRCGKAPITTNDTMMCCSCELTYGNSESDEYERCEWCGNRMHHHDVYYIDDQDICPDCYENETATCKVCGERHFFTNMSKDGTICRWCLAEEDE